MFLDVRFATVYRRITAEFFMLSNQMSHDIPKCIGMITIQSGEAKFVIGVAENCNDSCLGLKF